MAGIQILPPDVVDRIAAGEVLDRPANLVKELVENSLDAGADHIDIEFAEGGRSVMVTDNGSGMARSDLPLALQRHATSKITRSEDLFALHSFGFRGEALASIAAVSRLTLTSRLVGAEAFRVRSEFGVAEESAPVSAAVGTSLSVSDLFANVPARLKFLKSASAEHSQIKSTLKALALANESVGFSVRSMGELLYHWPKGSTFVERALAVLEIPELFAGRCSGDGFSAEVLVSSPQDSLNVNRNMWFFAQRRWIQDRSLTAAVLEAYRNLLMHGQYPTVVVRLTTPEDAIDVNVHPAKSQVKFRDSQLAFRVTSRAIREVLEKAPWLKGQAGLEVPAPQAQASYAAAANLAFSAREFSRTQYQSKSFPLAEVRASVESLDSGEFRWADLHVLGQLNQTYVLAQTREAFYMVDQHASHERVVFERLMESFKSGAIEVQNLLLPLVFDLLPNEVETLLACKEDIEKLGLALERMGPESIAVQSIPAIVNEVAVGEALRKLAHDLAENQGELAWERTVADVFASMACHSVVRAGQTLSTVEMQSLLQQMDQYPLSSFCPHGRPVYLKRRFSEIDRDFGRIV